jgi:hypothetical protein
LSTKAHGIFSTNTAITLQRRPSGACVSRQGFLSWANTRFSAASTNELVLACNPAEQSGHPMTASDIPHPTEPIWQIEGIHSSSIFKLASLINARANGGFWAIWGAGAKGVCLANRLPKEHLARLIDTNPAKQGFHVPGTHIPIQAPSRDTISDLQLIVIANPSYESEIRAELANHNYNGHVLVLSESLL